MTLAATYRNKFDLRLGMVLAPHDGMQSSIEEPFMSKRFTLLQEILPILIYLLACIACSTFLLF